VTVAAALIQPKSELSASALVMARAILIAA